MANIGIGVYLLCVVWLTAIFLVWISVRTGRSFGHFAIVGASVFSIILLSLPKLIALLEFDSQFTYNEKLHQKVCLVRYLTVAVVLLGTAVAATYSYFFIHTLKPFEYRRIRSFG